MDADRVADSEYRASIAPAFIWLPLVFSFIICTILIVMKLSESSPDAFMSWGWTIFALVMSLLVPFILSMIVYLVTSLRNKAPPKVQMNSREECDVSIQQEFRRRFGYPLLPFTDTGESIEGAVPMGKNSSDIIYFHLYRVRESALKRYVLALKNMRKDVDLCIFQQSTMNPPDIRGVIRELGAQLATNQVQFSESEDVFTDPMGRAVIKRKKTPVDLEESGDEEQEEKK